jgi:hypothetical protein
MAEIRILVRNTPPVGWQWQLVDGQKIIKTGNANSSIEARAAAKAALAKIEKSK